MLVIDKKLYYKLKLKLLKEFRLKDFNSMSSDGYAIHNIKNGKFTLEIVNKNYNKDPIYFEFDEFDEDFSFEVLNIMYKRGFYGKISGDDRYPVTTFVFRSQYGNLTIIAPRLDVNKDYMNSVSESAEKFIIENHEEYSQFIQDFQFSNLEDYKEFLDKGYRVMSKEYYTGEVLRDKIDKLEDKIKELNKELDLTEKHLKEIDKGEKGE